MSTKKQKCMVEDCHKKGKLQPIKNFQSLGGTGLKVCGSCRHRLTAMQNADKAQQSCTSAAGTIANESKGLYRPGAAHLLESSLQQARHPVRITLYCKAENRIRFQRSMLENVSFCQSF
jgi:hypothetical protein